jgi:hypothetical protein
MQSACPMRAGTGCVSTMATDAGSLKMRRACVRMQAVEEEVSGADQVHAEERLQHQRDKEAYEQEVTEWRIKFFDSQYER